MKPIFLSSYPRSGNTYLRAILNNCFELKSASVYPNDLGNRKVLENYVGHIEHSNDGKIPLQAFANKLILVKTHGTFPKNCKSIYVLRDARPVALSLYNFFDQRIPLEDVIIGNHPWGTWKDHVKFFTDDLPENRLVLRYEDLKDEIGQSLKKISEFLNVEIRSNKIPSRDAMVDGKWVNKERIHWKDQMKKHHIEICTEINKTQLKKYGYI
jgi:hypothetical protein